MVFEVLTEVLPNFEIILDVIPCLLVSTPSI